MAACEGRIKLAVNEAEVKKKYFSFASQLFLCIIKHSFDFNSTSKTHRKAFCRVNTVSNGAQKCSSTANSSISLQKTNAALAVTGANRQ